MKKLYRCSRRMWEEEVNIDTIELGYDSYDVIKETEKSYLIKMWHGKTKRVIKGCKGSFAFETTEEALENFKYRTKRSLALCKSNLLIAQMFYDKYVKNNEIAN